MKEIRDINAECRAPFVGDSSSLRGKMLWKTEKLYASQRGWNLSELHCYMSIDNHLQLDYYGVKLNGHLFRNHTYRDRKCVTDMSVGIGIAPVIISTLCSRDSGNIGGITYGFLF